MEKTIFKVHDDDARALFEWIIRRFESRGDLVARRPGERHGIVEYAALRVKSGEVGIMALSLMEEALSPRYAGLAVGWMRTVDWEEGYRWRGLRPSDGLLSLNQYATFEEALEAVDTR